MANHLVQHHLSVSIIGTGYVGLVTGATFAHHGIRTVCIDVDEEKVRTINNRKVPFFEKGMEELLIKGMDDGLLSATTDFSAIANTDVTFICVGTPSLKDGSADLSYVKSAARSIGEAIANKPGYHVIGTKSTVLPGTTEDLVLPILKEASGKQVDRDFGVVMIPEFLRQGQAVYDAMHPNRIIIGEHDKRAGGVIHWLYEGHRHESGDTIPILHVEIKAAELIKYAANSLLATKITFANEFSRICEQFNIDVYEVMKGVGLDFRINPMFLNAGCGFGGSCFPKDVKAIVSLSQQLMVETPLLDSVLRTNDIQPLHLVDITREALGGELKGKRIAFLGLAFKPDTDDTRETRALPIIEALHQEGALVTAYDPQATEGFKGLAGELPITYANTAEESIEGADCAIIQTDWAEIKAIEPKVFVELMKQPLVVDGRRTFDPDAMRKAGVTYRAIGWKNL
jgi:UDPglucose 6-dehydrogenase